MWQYLPALPDRPASVHLANFPSASDILGASVPVDDPKQSEDWNDSAGGPHRGLEGLEEARQNKLIGGANLEAQVTVTAAEPVFSVLARYQDRAALSVHRVGGHAASKAVRKWDRRGSVQVSKAEGEKCERCWNYSIHVGEDAVIPRYANAAVPC